jgi:aminomethyltransferase
VDFFGWHLPVQYEGLLVEHRAVRQKAGLFDVSHMGEIAVRGPGAAGAVQRLVTNDCSSLKDGEIIYTVSCFDNGCAVDDLLVYRMNEEFFLLVVNASNIEKDFAHFKANLPGVDVENLSDHYAQIALQGPASRDILTAAHPELADAIKGLGFYSFFESELEGEKIIFSRTGYTGELGFEIYLPPHLADRAARALMSAGEGAGLAPAGLGARDLLRFEAGYCLYGHELDEETDPYEAALSWLVKPDKGDFVGRDALLARKADSQARRLIGFRLPGRKIARQGFPIFHGDEEVGRVSSGSFSPLLDASLGMARVRRAFTKKELQVEIRGERIPIERVKLPFYQQPALRA